MKKLSLLFLTLLLVGGMLPALTRADNDSTSTPKVKRNNKVTAQADLDCVKTALVARETAIGAAYTKYYTAINAALAKRQADLTLAWAKPVVKERRAAIKLAWSDYNKAKKTANKAYNAETKTAWKNFRNAAKVCKINSNSDEPYGLNMGEHGDSSL
jgi:hypothetical protein